MPIQTATFTAQMKMRSGKRLWEEGGRRGGGQEGVDREG